MRAHVARAPRPAQPRHPIPSTAANTGPIAPIFACTPERPVHVVSCARLELQLGSVDGKPGATGRAQNAPLRTSQRIVQICLFLFAAIGLFGGTLQVYLGQPDTTPRLDNIHRFMAGIYLGTAIICLWAGITVRQQGTLVYLVALGVLLAGLGRLLSISQVGLPEPPALYLGVLAPELLVPCIMVAAQVVAQRHAAQIV